MIAEIESVADLLESLGGIPAHRVLLRPAPGTATEADVIAVLRGPPSRLCELIDGTLVEKPVGLAESRLAAILIRFIDAFVSPRNLGFVTGEQGMMWLTSRLLRSPDVAFTSWDRLPGRRMPKEPYPRMSPDLAVEVLSSSNTAKEMELKRRHYLGAGTSLVWEFDPEDRTVAVYTSADVPDAILTAADSLDGGTVLPGFKLSLAQVFAELDRHG